MPLGDVIICNEEEEKVVIERKSLTDLEASIKDGRYEEQSYRLNGLPHHNHNIIYIIDFVYVFTINNGVIFDDWIIFREIFAIIEVICNYYISIMRWF